MLVLRPVGLRWIDGVADDPEDLCAHAAVEFSVDREALLRPEDGDWTVSAAAIYLLRTLERDHTTEDRVAEFLIPCCGNMLVSEEGEINVTIIGCPKGRNIWIRHEGETVLVGDGHRVKAAAWRKAVHGFADGVEALYAASTPKRFFDAQERAGFARFVEEWQRRRGRGFGAWR